MVFRSSFYVYEELADNDKIGWNAVEKGNTTVGAGVPIAFVGQLAYHLPVKFFPKWKYGSSKIDRKDVFLIKDLIAQTEWKKSKKKAKSVYKKGSVIKKKVTPGPYFKKDLSKALNIPKDDPDGKYSNKDLRRLAVMVEWWDTKSKKWVYGRHPPHDVKLDKYGSFVLYFRFVRQLASNDPDLKHWNGWALSKTKHAYPEADGSYTAIGRPYVGSKVAKITIGGETLNGHPSYDQIIGTIIRGNHKNGIFRTSQFISVTDKEKEVYAKNPNISNIYWKEGEAQVWKVMDHIHEGVNKSDKPAKFLFMDVKMETEVEID